MRFVLESEHGGVLFAGPVGELVVAERVPVALCVVLLDELVSDGEEVEAGVELLNSFQDLAELGKVLHVLHLSGINGVDGTEGDGSGESFHL